MSCWILSLCCCCLCAFLFSVERSGNDTCAAYVECKTHASLLLLHTHTHTTKRQIQRYTILHISVTFLPGDVVTRKRLVSKNQKIWNRMNLNGPQIERIIRGQSVLGIPLTQIAQQEVTSPMATSSKKKKGGWRHFASGAVRVVREIRPRRN